MRRSVVVIISAMKSICGILYRNCIAIKSTFHRAMKRNGHNLDCKGEVTSRNALRIGVSNPYYALLSMVAACKQGKLLRMLQLQSSPLWVTIDTRF